MFPTSIKGEFEIKVLQFEDIDSVLSRVEQELAAARAANVLRTDNKITFRGGIFRFVSNWNVLVPVGYGEIEVLPTSVKYEFSCIEMLIVTTFMACIMCIFILSSIPVSTLSFVVPLLMWLWLFGMNYVIAFVRLPAFVRKIAGA